MPGYRKNSLRLKRSKTRTRNKSLKNKNKRKTVNKKRKISRRRKTQLRGASKATPKETVEQLILENIKTYLKNKSDEVADGFFSDLVDNIIRMTYDGPYKFEKVNLESNELAILRSFNTHKVKNDEYDDLTIYNPSANSEQATYEESFETKGLKVIFIKTPGNSRKTIRFEFIQQITGTQEPNPKSSYYLQGVYNGKRINLIKYYN